MTAAGLGPLLLASVLFGAMAVCVQLAARHMAAVQVACLRFAGSFVVLLALTRGRALWPRAASLGRLFLRGLLGAMSISCYYAGIGRAGAGLATLLYGTYTVWTAVWGIVLEGDRLTARIVTALLINLVGAVLVLGGGLQLGPGAVAGAAWALLGGVLAGGAVATAAHLRRTESAAVVTIHFMAVGAILTSPSLVQGLPPLSTPLVVALVGVVLTSSGGQWLLHHGLGYTSATTASLAAATSVVTAACLQALVVGEWLDARLVVAAICMLLAIALAASGRPVTAISVAESAD